MCNCPSGRNCVPAFGCRGRRDDRGASSIQYRADSTRWRDCFFSTVWGNSCNGCHRPDSYECEQWGAYAYCWRGSCVGTAIGDAGTGTLYQADSYGLSGWYSDCCILPYERLAGIQGAVNRKRLRCDGSAGYIFPDCLFRPGDLDTDWNRALQFCTDEGNE